MNLLIFIHSLSGGGAERVASTLANYWSSAGWNITVLTLSGERMDTYTVNPSVHRIRLGMTAQSRGLFSGLLGNVLRVRAIRRILRSTRPDVALSMLTTSNILLAVAVVGLPHIRTIGSERVHPPQVPLGRLWELLRRHCYGLLDCVVALTSESALWLEANTRARNVPVIPNPATWPLPAHTPTLSPDSLVQPGRKLVLAAGRLVEQKGFADLLAAFKECARRFPEWDLVILGEGALRPNLESQIAAEGLAGRAFLPGRAGNMGDWYARADLFVLSSRFEGFPNTLAEAMAYGVPAISFDCDTGPRDIVHNGVNGVLVPNGNLPALKEAMASLMHNPALRLRMAERAIDVRDRFSMAGIMAKWGKLLMETRDAKA